MGKTKSEGGPCDGCERSKMCDFAEVLTNPKSIIDTNKIFATLQGMKEQSRCLFGKEAKESDPDNLLPLLNVLKNKHGIISTIPTKALNKINFEKTKLPNNRVPKQIIENSSRSIEFDFTGPNGSDLMQKLLNLSSNNTAYDVVSHFGSNKSN